MFIVKERIQRHVNSDAQMDLKFIPTCENLVNSLCASENLQKGFESTEQKWFTDSLRKVCTIE